MALETERLLFRHWEDADAETLYRYAKDPAVGPIAGWPPHRSVEESRDTIRGVLARPETYAICLKSTGEPIGTIDLKMGDATDLANADDECEMGYWLGKPFWGQGMMTEAMRELLRHAFEDLGMSKVWVGHYDGNVRSRRVQEKCGFRYQWTTPDVEVPLMHETRVGHVLCLTREEWESVKRQNSTGEPVSECE
jgi:RimJ/RimL family protein N-acetyltransferase